MIVLFVFQQAKWARLMEEDEAVKKYALKPETHTKFSFGRRAGQPNYDMLVDES